MEPKKTLELLEQLKHDPKAQELLNAAEKPSDEKGMAKIAAQAAHQVGLPLEEEDILNALQELKREHKARTEAAADQVVKLNDSKLDSVTGGALDIHGNVIKCMYDFWDQSCFMQDACEVIYVRYFGCANVYHDYPED